jgi:hypothetical protein
MYVQPSASESKDSGLEGRLWPFLLGWKGLPGKTIQFIQPIRKLQKKSFCEYWPSTLKLFT